MNDWDLLQRYLTDESEDSFAELVRRYLGLVYSAAFRQVRSRELAEEVAQSVFTDLAGSAGRLRPDTVLGAWLYEVTRRTVVDVVRRESRRQRREYLAQEITDMNSSNSEWTEIEPLLDDAMAELGEPDRTAVLLRYFENKSLREIGEKIGASEDATQKRVSRAVERLRQHFSKRGITVGASGLISALVANAAQAAPAGVSVATLAKAALAGAAIKGSTTVGLTKVLAMTTAQKAAVGAIVIAAIGTGVYEARQATILKAEVAELKSQRAVAAAQTAPDRTGLAPAGAKLALQEENERLRKELADLPRLRGEVARLRAGEKGSDGGASDQQKEIARRWLERVDRLKQRLEQDPSNRIPEIALLTEQDWLNAAKGKLETEKDYRRAMSDLRHAGENTFAMLARPALSKYLQSNDWAFPSDMGQLQSFFKKSVDPAILDRYAILPSATVPNVKMGGDWIITQKEAVDPEYDTRWVIGPNGYGSTHFSGSPLDDNSLTKLEQSLTPALKAYAAANNGHGPVDPEQLRPYLTTQEQQTAFEKALELRKEKSAKDE